MKNSKVKEFKKFLKWFFSNTDNTEQNMKEYGTLYALVESLQYRVEDLENEQLIIMKEHRGIINALEQRIDILQEEVCTKN
tara:strand:- start:921 stop:1163 length:243 start_codon:yes stop_codon:yes gene_type:complete